MRTKWRYLKVKLVLVLIMLITGIVSINSDCIKYRFGPLDHKCGQDLVEKLNQKCRDAKRKVKKEWIAI